MEKKKAGIKTSTKTVTKVATPKVVEARAVTKITVPKVNADSFANALKSVREFIAKNSKVVSIVGYVLIAIASFALVDLFVQYLNNGYSIAVVDGSRIARKEYEKRLEQISGQSISTQLIDEMIFRQAAEEAKITVTSAEVDVVIKQYEDYLGGADALQKALDERKSNLADIKASIETDLLAKKVVTKDVKVSDADLKSFYEQYGSQMFPNEVTKDATDSTKEILPDFETKKAEILDIYLNQQYISNKDAWLAERKKSVTVQDNYANKPTYGLFKATGNLVQSLTEAVKAAK
jgi:hypothetical protein